jgi:MFS family permease
MAGGGLRPLTKVEGWPNALGVTLLGCVLLGGGCFVVLGTYLPERFDLFHAAVWQQVGFAVALGVILAVIAACQRARGESLREIGWRRPTTRLALVLGVTLGVLYLAGSYVGARETLPGTNVFEVRWERFVLAPKNGRMGERENGRM